MNVELKVRRVGNSLGIVLPKEALATLNLAEGDTLTATEAADGSLLLRTANPAVTRQLAVAADLMKRYRNTLRELAK